MQMVHKRFTCEKCSKTFASPSELDKHLNYHEAFLVHMQSCYVSLKKTKIYTCVLCTRGFLEHNRYKEHQRQYFKLSGNSQDNNEDNNNKIDKPFKCEDCGKRFVLESTLKTHSIVHQPFPHVCSCGIGYYKKCDLDGHRKLVHPNENGTTKPTEKVKLEIKYKSDSENEELNFEEKPKSKVGPRLKAALTYKKQKMKSSKTSTSKLRKNDIIQGQKVHNSAELPEVFPKINSSKQKYNQGGDKKTFTCEICCKKFAAKAHVQVHMRIHTKEKPYKCDQCDKSFTQSGALKIHKMIHVGVKDHHCDHCNKSFYVPSTLARHRRTHTGEKPYKCKTCTKCFADPSALNRHELIHTGLKPYKCEHCPKSYCDSAALYRHRQLHQNATVQCKLCPKEFRSRYLMLNHMRMMHAQRKILECDYCGKWFTYKPNLVTHIKCVHLNLARIVECEICDKKLSLNSYRPHMKSHLGLKVECDICGVFLKNKETLKVHRVIHGNREKKYECDYCHKTFYSKVYVASHIKFSHLFLNCEVCKRRFYTRDALNAHVMNECTRCSDCNMKFESQNDLRDHNRVHHSRHLQECHVCCERFPTNVKLTLHIKSAHNINIYKCDSCSSSFSMKTRLRKHIWEKHMISLYCNICLGRFYNEYQLRKHRLVKCKPKERCGKLGIT